jgi:hypothetical protein
MIAIVARPARPGDGAGPAAARPGVGDFGHESESESERIGPALLPRLRRAPRPWLRRALGRNFGRPVPRRRGLHSPGAQAGRTWSAAPRTRSTGTRAWCASGPRTTMKPALPALRRPPPSPSPWVIKPENVKINGSFSSSRTRSPRTCSGGIPARRKGASPSTRAASRSGVYYLASALGGRIVFTQACPGTASATAGGVSASASAGDGA